jgi:hypothetical protein
MNSSEEKGIIEAFVARWVIKNRRERALFELTHEKKRSMFIDRLNHQWESVLDMRYLVKVGKADDSLEGLYRIMRIDLNYAHYAISTYPELDGRIMQLSEGLVCVYARGFASLLVSAAADVLYLETEQVQGPPARFTGHWRLT